jgi:cell division protein FtsL
MRLLNFCLVILLVLATAYVYEIKFDATLRATRVAEMRSEVRREREAIATLRAEWARLENPARLEALARRHLGLRPAEISQFDSLDALPGRPVEIVAPPDDEAMASVRQDADAETPTGSIPEPLEGR